MPESNTRKGPLAGIRIVDLTAMVMGPYATQIMADMGADVIKVEAPAGDDTRYISVGPAPGMGGIFVNVNRGKRSIVLDLRTPEGKAALTELIRTADVFIHSMRSKAIARLGFAYEDVAAINPSIVYTNCYGYGRRGPDADLPAYDDTIQAECGLPAVQQMLTGQADFIGTIMADKVAGLTCLYSTVMALFHRERTGEGQEVEIGMFETMAAFMLVEHANGALFDPPLGEAFYPRVVSPNRKPYQTKDGQISALIYNDKHWATFINAVQPAWASDEFARLDVQDFAQRAAGGRTEADDVADAGRARQAFDHHGVGPDGGDDAAMRHQRVLVRQGLEPGDQRVEIDGSAISGGMHRSAFSWSLRCRGSSHWRSRSCAAP